MWKWPKYSIWYFFVLGFLWLFWQLFLDELAGLAREHIPEGGIIMYSITHPYIIMPSLLILICLFIFVRSKRKPKEDAKTTINVSEECTNILKHIHERDLKLKDKCVKQYHVLFNGKDFRLFLDLFANAQNGYEDVSRDIKKDIGKKKLSKDIVKKHQQIDGLTEKIMSSAIMDKDWTFAEIIGVGNLIDKLPNRQNPKYRGIRSLRKTDKKWNNLFKSLQDIKVRYSNIFSDAELKVMVNDYPEWSLGGSSVLILVDLLDKFALGYLPTEYVSSGTYAPYEKIENRMTKLLEGINNRIRTLVGELRIELHSVISYNWIPTHPHDILSTTSDVEATVMFYPQSSVKIDSLYLHIGRNIIEADHLPILTIDSENTYNISFKIPNNILTIAFNKKQNSYIQLVSGNQDWRSNDCGFSIGAEGI